jgi:hypothetical protein
MTRADSAQLSRQSRLAIVIALRSFRFVDGKVSHRLKPDDEHDGIQHLVSRAVLQRRCQARGFGHTEIDRERLSAPTVRRFVLFVWASGCSTFRAADQRNATGTRSRARIVQASGRVQAMSSRRSSLSARKSRWDIFWVCSSGMVSGWKKRVPAQSRHLFFFRATFARRSWGFR